MKTKKNETSFVWTQEKIIDLISQYQNNECLWNVLTEDYKSREKRDIAISSICSSLNITREQFSKKIHNLRNQFNYEAKKVSQRNDNVKNSYRSKWEYYEKLLFLKNVISPRPGPNYGLCYDEVQNTNNGDYISIDSFKADKSQPDVVHILEAKPGLEHNVVIYQETTSQRGNHSADSSIISNSSKTYPIAIQRAISMHESQDKSHDFSQHTVSKNENQSQSKTGKSEKRQEIGTRSKKKQLASPSIRETPPQPENEDHETQTFEISRAESPTPKKIMKRNSNFGSSNKIVQQYHPHQYNNCKNEIQLNQSSQRDEYDLFGEFVANELRNLNHDSSRKKLKRRIMKAMLDTANEDDDSTD
ncbi:uncharacterized protein LOC129610067 [Condylostylus longicornis]|uniref:uncharacterized protein LOC129610067 n=1 Tax=Condylostylus longicornis TaxID=2530218 RepID=UPI00244E12F2|nr:uncharacterized protein LOC129610067 [Condylostylus longicornis]